MHGNYVLTSADEKSIKRKIASIQNSKLDSGKKRDEIMLGKNFNENIGMQFLRNRCTQLEIILKAKLRHMRKKTLT